MESRSRENRLGRLPRQQRSGAAEACEVGSPAAPPSLCRLVFVETRPLRLTYTDHRLVHTEGKKKRTQGAGKYTQTTSWGGWGRSFGCNGGLPLSPCK